MIEHFCRWYLRAHCRPGYVIPPFFYGIAVSGEGVVATRVDFDKWEVVGARDCILVMNGASLGPSSISLSSLGEACGAMRIETRPGKEPVAVGIHV